jgi:alpha-tubulin suppressor-like RCC1 family protein
VLTGWLYETTRHTAACVQRTNARRHAREQEAYMESTLTEEPNAAADWNRLAPHLEAAMSQLGEGDRTLLALRFYENKNGAEAAALLGIREAAAHKRTARALEKLRGFFTRRGVALSAAAIAGAVSANSVQAAPVALMKTISTVAMAKSAAATASNLALVKGALKLMAWTKVKTTMVTGVAIILAATATVGLRTHMRHAPPHQTGRLKLPTGNVAPMIACGYSHDGIILASDGSLWSWGEERFGAPVLGLTNTNIQNTVSLRRIGNETDWINIAVGDQHCLAVKSDGTLWAWGANYACQLGDGTKISRPTPVPSIPGNDWKQTAAGADGSFAVKTDGTLWAWGIDNGSGQYGNGGTKGGTNAVQVGASTNWAKIWAGGIQVVGLQADGSLWFWGSVTGDANGKKILLPTRVSPDTNWVDVCFGYFTVLAIKSDGTLWSWGNQARFYTGNNDADLDATPRQVGTESDWQSCASSPGCFYHILKKTDGSLWALDASEHRRIKPDSQYQPVKLHKLDLHKDIVAFTAGGDDIGVILTRDGEVWTWGRVWGELSSKDYRGPNGQPVHSDLKSVAQPWQLLNLDSGD